MEDAWGSPWTADAPPKLDLPAPPPHAHFSLEHTGTNHHSNTSPQRISPNRLPWDDDDAWGGWNDAKEGTSPGWGTSPGLKPTLEPVSRLSTPSPALGVGLDVWNEAETKKKDRSADSAISLRERSSPIKPKDVSLNAEDMWRTADTVDTADTEPPSESSASPPTSDDDARSSTSEVPPKLALPPGTRPAAVRQSSKVQELVEMFDGFARRSHSVSPSPIEPPKRALSGTELVDAVSDGLKKKDVAEEDKSEGESDEEEEEEGEEEEEFADFEVETRIDEVKSDEVKHEILKTSETTIETLLVQPLPAEEIVHEPLTESETTEKQDDEIAKETAPEEPLKSPIVEERVSEDEESLSESSTEPDREVSVQPEAQDDRNDAIAHIDTQEEVEHGHIRTVDHDEPEENLQEPGKQANIIYSADLSKLGDLFPSVDTSFPTPEPVPDVIIDDTFASISERKAWYRMSRFGSLQMHNMGDDENYTRTTWNNSIVRDRSIRIVRRWMEEDSIAGRVVLGRRTAASGKIFNWDSSAPQVEIKELFGRRNHARQESATPKETESTAPSPSVAIPAFGWSSASSPTFAIPPPFSHVSPTTQHVPVTKAPRAATPALQTLGEPVPITKSAASPIPPLGRPPMNAFSDTKGEEGDEDEEDEETEEEESDEEDSEDDDDDWGEMVSSPTAEPANAFSSLNEVANTPPTANDTLLSPAMSATPPNEILGGFTAPTPAVNVTQQLSQTEHWGFGDMSFLDGASSATQPTPHIPASSPTPPPAPKQTDFSILPKTSTIMTPLSPISISSPQTSLAPPGPPAPKQDTLNITTNDDEIVANILRGLPDLSYMLR